MSDDSDSDSDFELPPEDVNTGNEVCHSGEIRSLRLTFIGKDKGNHSNIK
jgi:hypothetical protein